MKIPFAKVHVGKTEKELVNQVLENGWLTTGAKTHEFETKFAEFINVPFACAVNSCTAALHLALDAVGVGYKDKVFVPSMTFTSSAEIIRYLGGDPIFLDTEYRTNLVTPEILNKAIKKYPDVKVLIIVHFSGQAVRMTEIKNICKNSGIKIIEDAAHAFPTKHDGKYIGNFGDITCFSFYANKTITTGEGGMLVTHDESIYNRVKIMRLHGINRDVWDRFTSDKPSWEYDVIEAGYKYNLPDICSAVGIGQLQNASLFRDERQKVAEFYYDALKNIDTIDLPICHGKLEDHSWHLFPIVINEASEIGRNEFIIKMSELGIGTSVHYKPIHRMTYYRKRYNLNENDFPNAEKTWKGNVSLPIYPFMSNDELNFISDSIKNILKL